MTAGSLVLVAAPDVDFSRSIIFVLASERYEIEAHRYASEVFASPRADQAACAVLDEEAIESWPDIPAQFERFGRPVILLVSLFRVVPNTPLLKPLGKPFLGEPLIHAVRNAITGGL